VPHFILLLLTTAQILRFSLRRCFPFHSRFVQKDIPSLPPPLCASLTCADNCFARPPLFFTPPPLLSKGDILRVIFFRRRAFPCASFRLDAYLLFLVAQFLLTSPPPALHILSSRPFLGMSFASKAGKWQVVRSGCLFSSSVTPREIFQPTRFPSPYVVRCEPMRPFAPLPRS